MEPSSQEAGFTALHMAARHGHVPVLRFLLEAGAKLDCRDQMGANVLHTAAEHGQVPTVKDLWASIFKKGKDPSKERFDCTRSVEYGMK